MYWFFVQKFCYLFGFFLSAQVSKTIAEADAVLVDEGNIKLNIVLNSIIIFLFRHISLVN